MPPLRRLTLTAGRALEPERGVRHLPAVADRTDPHVVAHSDIGQEDLVERRRSAHLPDRPDLDAGCVHRDQEHRQPGLLGDVRIGPGEQQSVVGEPGAGRPHLLAVDAPSVVLPHRGRRDGGQVGTGSRLAEQLTAQQIRAQEGPGELLALRVGAEGRDRRADQPGRDADQFGRGRRLEPLLLGGERRRRNGATGRRRPARPAARSRRSRRRNVVADRRGPGPASRAPPLRRCSRRPRSPAPSSLRSDRLGSTDANQSRASARHCSMSGSAIVRLLRHAVSTVHALMPGAPYTWVKPI